MSNKSTCLFAASNSTYDDFCYDTTNHSCFICPYGSYYSGLTCSDFKCLVGTYYNGVCYATKGTCFSN